MTTKQSLQSMDSSHQGTSKAKKKAQTPISTSIFSVSRDYKNYMTGWTLANACGAVMCLPSMPLCFLGGSIHAVGNGHTTCTSEVGGHSWAKVPRWWYHLQSMIISLISGPVTSGAPRLARTGQPAVSSEST